MLITAKFPSTCKTCGRTIIQGERISWTRGVREVEHAACSAEGKTMLAEVAKSAATDASVDLPCPAGLEYLGFQRAGIAYALAKGSCLIADEMGLGKTVQAIGVMSAANEVRTVLVVCPASLKLNWQRECQKWLARSASVEVFPHRMVDGYPLHVTIINYEQLKKLSNSQEWDLLVCDEAHYAKNPKSARTKLVQAVAKRCKRKLLLTGTPILNKPVELFPLLQIVAPEEFDPRGSVRVNGRTEMVEAGNGAGFWRFVKRYCDAHEEYHGRTKHWNFDGASNLPELQERLRSTCMVRRLKADVLSELPPKRRRVVILQNDYERDEVDELADDYETAISQLTHGKVAFEDISRVRHEQGLKKVDGAVAHIREALEGGSQKIIVFAHHTDVIQDLAEGLNDYEVSMITGETGLAARQDAVDRFQNGAARVFLGSIGAAGVGLTLTASSHVIFVEGSWRPADMTQAEDRAHRIGQQESVLVEVLCLDGTLDAKMMRMVQEKQEIADLALDLPTIEAPKGPLAPVVRAVPEDERVTVHAQLRYLAARCDGAVTQDGQGFNGLDTNIGKSLARCERLTDRQAALAKRMLVKYTRQLEGMNYGAA